MQLPIETPSFQHSERKGPWNPQDNQRLSQFDRPPSLTATQLAPTVSLRPSWLPPLKLDGPTPALVLAILVTSSQVTVSVASTITSSTYRIRRVRTRSAIRMSSQQLGRNLASPAS